MLSTSRKVLALTICLAVLGLVAYGRFGSPTSSTAKTNTTLASNVDCRRCHEEVWQQWEASYHSRAWSDDAVQATFQHFGFDRQCQSCHAPEPIFVAGLTTPVALRQTDVQSGVNCLSCHALPGGESVAATRTVSDAPCKPVAVPELSQSQACSGCHVAIYKDWAGSRYEREGKTCQSCHMPAGEGGVRSHQCLGSHDETLVRSGARMECRIEEDSLVVEVTNHATGHNYPGERHNRMLYVQVLETTADGEIALARQELIKGITPFRGETSAEKIKIDETFTARFSIVKPATLADVQLIYRPFPWYTDRQSLIVHRQEVPLSAELEATSE